MPRTGQVTTGSGSRSWRVYRKLGMPIVLFFTTAPVVPQEHLVTTRGSYEELEKRCLEIPGLLRHGDAYSASFLAWRKDVESLLRALFGADSEPSERFRAIYYTPLFLSCRTDLDVFPEAFRDGLGEARRLLQELLDRRPSHWT